VLDYNNIVKAKEVKALTEGEAVTGRKVRHAKFGVGTIVMVNKKDGKINLTIAFENMGIKNLRLDLAPLEII
jgi:DNA helicase-2/ATP-dependent DNA helicase PcrA